MFKMHSSVAMLAAALLVLTCTIVQADTISYWEFNEKATGQQSTGTAGEFIDSTGNGHDGYGYGNPLPYYSADDTKNPTSAIVLTKHSNTNNDVAEDCVVIPHSSDFNLMMADGVDYLIEADIKTSAGSYADNAQPVIFSHALGYDSYAFRLTPYVSGTSVKGRLTLYIQGDASFSSTSSYGIAGSTVVADGQWHHVAVAIDSNKEHPELSSVTFYIDGVADGTVVLTKTDGSAWGSVNIDSSLSNHSDDVLIGDYADMATKTGCAYYRRATSQFIGDISSVKFSVVPEPATFSLILSGLIGLLAYAWRKRK